MLRTDTPRPRLHPLPAMTPNQLGCALATWAAGSPREEAAVALLMTAGGHWLRNERLMKACTGIAEHPAVHDAHRLTTPGQAPTACGCASVTVSRMALGLRDPHWTHVPLARIDWAAANNFVRRDLTRMHLAGGASHHALLDAAIAIGGGAHLDLHPLLTTWVDPGTLTRILDAIAHAAGWRTDGRSTAITGHLDIQRQLHVAMPDDVLDRFWPPADVLRAGPARALAFTLLGQAARLLLTNWPNYATLAATDAGQTDPDPDARSREDSADDGLDPTVLDLVDDALDAVHIARLALTRLAEHTGATNGGRTR